MLTTYDRYMNMREPRVIRRGVNVTTDNRPEYELVQQLQAEVEALRAQLRKMESKS
jgi:hypothetical protein